MTQAQESVLKLIRIAVSGKDNNLPINTNWLEVMDVATNQGVLGLCFDSIELLPSGQHHNMDILMDWLGQVSYMENCHEEHKKAIVDLVSFYDDQAVRMMILKGFFLFVGLTLIIVLKGMSILLISVCMLLLIKWCMTDLNSAVMKKYSITIRLR